MKPTNEQLNIMEDALMQNDTLFDNIDTAIRHIADELGVSPDCITYRIDLAVSPILDVGFILDSISAKADILEALQDCPSDLDEWTLAKGDYRIYAYIVNDLTVLLRHPDPGGHEPDNGNWYVSVHHRQKINKLFVVCRKDGKTTYHDHW